MSSCLRQLEAETADMIGLVTFCPPQVVTASISPPLPLKNLWSDSVSGASWPSSVKNVSVDAVSANAILAHLNLARLVCSAR